MVGGDRTRDARVGVAVAGGDLDRQTDLLVLGQTRSEGQGGRSPRCSPGTSRTNGENGTCRADIDLAPGVAECDVVASGFSDLASDGDAAYLDGHEVSPMHRPLEYPGQALPPPTLEFGEFLVGSCFPPELPVDVSEILLYLVEVVRHEFRAIQHSLEVERRFAEVMECWE